VPARGSDKPGPARIPLEGVPPADAAARAPDAGPAAAQQARSFGRALIATNFLLGKRGAALSAGVNLNDPASDRAAAELHGQLSHGSRQHRARVLAAEVGRIVRSLRAQRIR
jgi:hypothetical protein